MGRYSNAGAGRDGCPYNEFGDEGKLVAGGGRGG